MDRNRVVGLLGVTALVVGVFSPVFKIPGGKALTFFESGIVDGAAVVCLSILSAIFLFARNYRALLFTGIGSLAIIANMFAYFHAQFLGTRTAEAVSNALVRTGPTEPQLQWGWAPLVLGSILTIACPLISERPSSGASKSPLPGPDSPDRLGLYDPSSRSDEAVC